VDAASKTVELLIRVDDGQNISGRDLAAAWRDSKSGAEPIVSFRIKQDAQQRFAILTKPENKERSLAILLDGVVQSAPVLKAQLSSGGIIEGYRGRERERNEVVTILNSGQLAASLGDPVFERTVGPQLGEDNIQKGVRATALGLVLVLAFMAVYYRFAGVVADLALLLNMVMTVSIMYIIDQAWTLPGIGGLILTMGMSVDANVLIYERLREEKGREGSLAFALKRAYSRAFRTILDSNVTTLIPAFVLLLPWLATEEVKGFAVVMVLGIGLNMFTAIVVTRMVFETGMRAGWVKDLKMLQLFSAPSVRWMHFTRYAIVASGALVLLGAILFYGRGQTKYDIEFTGGTQVALALRVPGAGEAQKIETVRGRIAETFGPAAVVQALDVEKRPGEEDLDTFLVSVSSIGRAGEKMAGEAEVRKRLMDLFADMWPKTGQGVDVEAADSEITVDLIRKRLEAGRAPAAAAAPTAPGSPAAPEYLYIPDEYRRFIGKVRLEARTSVGLSDQDVREEMYRFLRERHRDVVDIEIRVRGTAAAESPGRFTALDIWIQDDFGAQRANVPAPEFWKGVLQGALGKREFLSVTSFEPTMAAETWQKAIMAIVFSMGLIAVYVWIRFAKLSYGVASVVALAHDVIITLGAVAACGLVAAWWTGNPFLITDMKINMPMVGAFLTLIGYSLNDTIVVFDRIRENRGKFGELSVEVTNRSVNQTLTRTIWTGFTTFLVVGVLYVVGGAASTLHGFSFVMTFGVIIGTYSSVAIASPILVMRDYLLRAYAAAYPFLAAVTMAYVLVTAGGTGAAPWVLVGLWAAWLVPAAWGTWCHAHGRPWPLEAQAPRLVKGVAAVGLLAPVLAVAMCAVLLLVPPEMGWQGWAGPAFVGALFTVPASITLYRAAWGSFFQKT
jgi:SecD/SecF fusion protein